MSNPEVVNCVFQGNSSVGGGGMLNVSRGSHPTITNCTLTGNSASAEESGGGGMFNSAASPTVTNCILWGGGDPAVFNYIKADPSFRHCDIEGSGGSANWNTNIGRDGGYNIDVDPEFKTPGYPPGPDDDVWLTADDGLRLGDSSPCIDAADGDFAPKLDACGYGREDVAPTGGGTGNPDYVDIGAYEYHRIVVHFSGVFISDAYNESKAWSEAFVDDDWSDLVVGAGEWPDTETAVEDAVDHSLDSIAIPAGVKLTVWSKKDFQGDILLEQWGPAVIYNLYWDLHRDSDWYPPFHQAMTKGWGGALQIEFPPSVRKLSQTDMYVDPLGVNNKWWGKGSFKVE